MCVIIQKPRGAKLCSRIIANAFAANQDGAGFMWRDNAHVHIRKGFMRLHDLLDALVAEGFFDRATQQIEPDMELALHFRIATSGGVCPGRTHPFPLSRSYKVLEQVSQTADVAIMHNGVISGYGDKTDFSDTQEFISSYLYHCLTDGMDKDTIEAIFTGFYGRFLLMGVDMLYRVGYWIEYEGLHCSNLSFNTPPTTYPINQHRRARHGSTSDSADNQRRLGYRHSSQFDNLIDYDNIALSPAPAPSNTNERPYIHLVRVCHEKPNCIYCTHFAFHDATKMATCEIWRKAKSEAVQHCPELAEFYNDPLRSVENA